MAQEKLRILHENFVFGTAQKKKMWCRIDTTSFSFINQRHPTSPTNPTPKYHTTPYFETAYTWCAGWGIQHMFRWFRWLIAQFVSEVLVPS